MYEEHVNTCAEMGDTARGVGGIYEQACVLAIAGELSRKARKNPSLG
jgi:hypothetical protein